MLKHSFISGLFKWRGFIEFNMFFFCHHQVGKHLPQQASCFLHLPSSSKLILPAPSLTSFCFSFALIENLITIRVLTYESVCPYINQDQLKHENCSTTFTLKSGKRKSRTLHTCHKKRALRLACKTYFKSMYYSVFDKVANIFVQL